MGQHVTLQLPSAPRSPGPPLNGARVLLLGYGYVAKGLHPHLSDHGMTVNWTQRDTPGPENAATGALAFSSSAMAEAAERADFILSSIPPKRDHSDPGLDALKSLDIQARWIGYLSATSVYGDRDGGWASEMDSPTPTLDRGRRRADAEIGWLSHFPQTEVFRLAGIYGPGRSPFSKLRDGSARVVEKPGHVVNRVHVDDIVSALLLSMESPCAMDIFNLADGLPAPPGNVLDYAAELLGVAKAERVALDDERVSDMARSFYAETKKIDSSRAQARLNWAPKYRGYQSGLRAILEQENSAIA